MDANEILADYAVKLRWEDIPQEVVTIAKKSILDTLGAILGASGISPKLKILAEMTKEFGGREESTILGFGYKVPAYLAAFVNGAMAHFLDYDDLQYPMKLHPSAPAVSAGLAIAERIRHSTQRPVSGKEFIMAVVLGQDIMSRIVKSASWNRSERPLWHMSQVCGVFGAAATSGKLLSLSSEQLIDAFGLALCQAAGTMELRYGVESDLGGMYVGFAAKGGVLSSLMSERGITGVKKSLEGVAGLFNTYFNGNYDRDILLSDLCKRFEGIDIGFKAWPACGSSHNHLEAALKLISDYDIKAEDIAEIVLFVDNFAKRLCEPFDIRSKPTSTMDAKFSLPYTIGVVAVFREVALKHYSAEYIGNERVLNIAGKVKCILEPTFNTVRELPPGKVQIRTRDGNIYTEQINIPYGHPQRPLTMERVIEKFMDCAQHSVKKIPADNFKQLIRLISELENLDDMNQIIRLVS